MKFTFHQKGFTLIELLVVVAIISLLSSVVLASVRESRNKAELSSVITQVKQVQNALELYKNETGTYPITSGLGVNTNLIPNYLSAHIKPLKLPNNLTITYMSKESSAWTYPGCTMPTNFDRGSKEYFMNFTFSGISYCYGI